MVDFLTNREYKLMKGYIQTFQTKNGRFPNYVVVSGMKITRAQYEDMNNRFNKFLQKNGREPGRVSINPPGTTLPVTQIPINSWLSNIDCYAYDKQDTGHTCGPSSLLMALACYDIILDKVKGEKFIAKTAGTISTGTSRPGLKNALIVIGKKYGIKLALLELFIADLGFETISEKYLEKGIPVLCHYVCKPLPNWKYEGGHYSVIKGISNSKIKIRCPVKGDVDYKRTTFKKALLHREPSILPLIKVR